MKIRQFKRPVKLTQILYVKWDDHHSSKQGWQCAESYMEKFEELAPCETAGWLVGEDKKWLHISINKCDKKDDWSDDAAEIMNILKSAIIERKVLLDTKKGKSGGKKK